MSRRGEAAMIWRRCEGCDEHEGRDQRAEVHVCSRRDEQAFCKALSASHREHQSARGENSE